MRETPTSRRAGNAIGSTPGTGPPRAQTRSLHDVEPSAHWHRRRGRRLFDAVVWYLPSLRWPPAEDPVAISHITGRELVIDFETATGMDLPLQGRSSPTLNAKAKSFLSILHDIEEIAHPLPVLRGSWTKARSLYPLVGIKEYHGLTRRPVFVGGRATLDTIRRMTKVRHLADSNRPGVALGLEWGHAEIDHDPPTRQRAALAPT